MRILQHNPTAFVGVVSKFSYRKYLKIIRQLMQEYDEYVMLFDKLENYPDPEYVEHIYQTDNTYNLFETTWFKYNEMIDILEEAAQYKAFIIDDTSYDDNIMIDHVIYSVEDLQTILQEMQEVRHRWENRYNEIM
jgi:ubiquinone/menaquinone biosynthesis C-methylase UbiE